MNRYVFILMLFLTCYTGGVVMADANTGKTLRVKENGQGRYTHIMTNESARHIVDHPAFQGFGQLILPREHDTYSLDTPLSSTGLMRLKPLPEILN